MQFHPIVFTFKPLPRDKRAALKASIQANGCRHPVVVWDGQIIDGRHRFDICTELGIDPPVQVFCGTEEQAVALAESLNEDRRQMAEAEIAARRERVAQARREGLSLRAIAEREDVSEKTVRNDLEASTAEGYAVDPANGTVTGRDGKRRPAKTVKELADEVEVVDGEFTDRDRAALERQLREPGADDRGLGGTTRPPRNGSVPFDWAEFHRLFGGLTRQISKLYVLLGLVDRAGAVARDEDYERVAEALREYLKIFKVVYQAKTGQQPPK